MSLEQIEEYGKSFVSSTVGSNLGALILGYGFDTTLLGVMFTQLVRYMTETHNERLFIRSVVIFTCAVAFATTIYTTHVIWDDFVTGYGLYSQYVDSTKIVYWSLLHALTVVPVQMFYCERAYLLAGRKIWVVIPIIMGMLVEVAASLAIFIYTLTHDAVVIANDPRTKLTYVWSAATLIVDLLLTFIICQSLLKSKSGFVYTDTVINRIVTMSLEGAIPPLFTALGFLITYVVRRQEDLLCLFFEIFAPKVYVVVLLAILNSRTELQKESASRGHEAARTNTMGFGLGVTTRTGTGTIIPLDRIHIDVETTTKEDTAFGRSRINGGKGQPFDSDSAHEIDQQLTYHDESSRTGLTYSPPPSRKENLA